jgi:uncharacterized membrane protein
MNVLKGGLPAAVGRWVVKADVVRSRGAVVKRRGSKAALAVFFIGAGVNHFVIPGTYERIVPPGLGDPAMLVRISGVAEVAGGVGVLVPRTRRPAGFGLIALLVAVLPANVFMALNPAKFAKIPAWTLYARLPLQPLMMRWAWRATKPS